MGNPPPGGTLILTITSCIVALWITRAGAQMSQEDGCPAQEKILPCRCSSRGMEFQIWCSHSELPSVLQGLKAVGHYVTHPVDELILENNNLPSLPGNVFTSLRVLRLMLRNNRLERVASSWLEGLHDSLLELFIVEPELRSLPIDSLENLQGLEAVTLQSGTMKRLPRFTGLEKLRYLRVNSPSLMELSPLNFRHLPKIEEIHVFGSPLLSRLEAGLLRNLPRLSLLNMSNNAIARIHPRALINLPELKEISLNDNEIADASIVGRAIVDLPSLTSVNLNGNRISRLEESDFVDNPALSRLTIARNYITNVGAGAFQRLTNLRILDLSQNRVRRVSPEFFLQRTTGSTGLEELWLVDNEIRHFNELRAILEALPGLKILDLSHNFLEEIPYGALRGHPTLERLHLDHNRLGFLERDTFVAMPALRELRLRNNSLNDLLEAPFWNLPGLKGLDLSENYFRHLEPRLLGKLPNLRRLDLSGNGIAVIEADTFVDTPALEHINISGNALSTLHPMTFRRLTSLYELDAARNRLSEMVPSLPSSIEHLSLSMNRIVTLPSPESRDLALAALRSLDLGANGIEIIPPGALARLAALRKLNLGYNSLRLIDDGTFDGLIRLEKLDLRHNRLSSLHGRSLKPLRNLMDFNVRGNRLEVIRPDLFEENIKLQRLDVSHNNLGQIARATFSGPRDLREFYASHNTLTELPWSLHGLHSLEILDLSFNKINILSAETLGGLTSLLELGLARNRIEELGQGAFDRLPRLTLIDLENNHLGVIEKHAIRSLPELQSLRLGKNRLRSIPSGAFTDLPLLQSAELQENHIDEIASDAFINVPHLLFLNVSNNRLSDLSYVGLEGLRSLEVLDLSNNRISGISSDSLAALEWLVELKLDHNRICGIRGSPFDDMPRLRVLSLRSNRMTSVKEKAFSRLGSNMAVLDIDDNPLSCSCDMLWLRGWLQQRASTDGPRCADGSLFKEIRLSRQDCQRAAQTETLRPGCEAETSPISSSLYTAEPDDSSPEWTNLGEAWKDDETWQNLDHRPSPPYDRYPSDENPVNSSRGKKNESSSSARPSATTTSRPTPGQQLHSSLIDRSNLSASVETKNTLSSAPPPVNSVTQKIPNRRKKPSVPPSPGSSGFTFFGVPLPSINFNLWGNSGTARSSKTRRKDSSEDIIDRSNLRRPGQSRYRVFPPTEPEIHRGGFFPLSRGQSGFVPIPDPRLTNAGQTSRTKNATRETHSNGSATITRVGPMPPPPPPMREIDRKIPFDKSIVKHREESTTDVPPSYRAKNHSKPREISAGERKDEKISPVRLENSSLSTETDNFLPTELPPLSVEPFSSSSTDFGVISTSSSETRTDDNNNNNNNNNNDTTENDFTSVRDTERMKIIANWDAESRLPPDTRISAESSDEQDPDDGGTSVSREIEAEKSLITSQNVSRSEASALSALLVPGGQVLASTLSSRPPSGRSTIVKVASPRSSFVADAFSTGTGQIRPDSFNADGRSTEETTDSSREDVRIVEDNPFNWYFRNYNESNIESDYVAVVYSDASKKSLSIFSILVVLFNLIRLE